MKKFMNPSLRVIEVENSVIATSFGVNNVQGNGHALKGGMMDFDFEDEEF